MKESIHVPVMLDKVVEYLEGIRKEYIVDCTFGGGGHSVELLKKFPEVKVIGIDRDLNAIKRGEMLKKDFKDRLSLFHSNFKNLPSLLNSINVSIVDAVLADLGVSSDLLEEPERGFSFQKDGPLDMRMDETSSLTAEMVLNSYPRERLEKIFFEYGQERFSRRIAKVICEYRKKKRITTTKELAELISRHVRKNSRIHPATRIFQALRIEVNNELNSLNEFLRSIPPLLSAGGRIVVISFHSLEDRIVKSFFRESEEKGILKIITKKPLSPNEEEIVRNPRARSARMRVAEKCLSGGRNERVSVNL